MFDARYPPPFTGGKERQAHLLARALRGLAVDVRVLTLQYGPAQPDAIDGIAVTRCPDNLRRFVCIRAHLKRWRTTSNMCHIHTPSWIGVYTGLIAKAFGYRVIFKIPNVQLTRLNGRLWCRAIRSFDRLVVLDDPTRREYEAVGVDPGRIAMGANGVPVRDRPRVRRGPAQPLQLLFLGRLVEQKGCHSLLTAARQLAERASDWHLTMVGSGPLEDELRATIGASDLTSRVTLRPWQDDVDGLLQETDLLVLPSRREGMSNVILEAMSAGVPVVATDVGATRRLIGEDGGPFIVPPDDPGALCRALLALMHNPAARATYGIALHERARRLFDIELIARQYRQLYEQTLETGH